MKTPELIQITPGSGTVLIRIDGAIERYKMVSNADIKAVQRAFREGRPDEARSILREYPVTKFPASSFK